jgi:hypothetical protein
MFVIFVCLITIIVLKNKNIFIYIYIYTYIYIYIYIYVMRPGLDLKLWVIGPNPRSHRVTHVNLGRSYVFLSQY